MSTRILWIVQDADGDALSGQTVTLHNNATDALIGTFTDNTDGTYQYDLATTTKVKVKVGGTIKLANWQVHADDVPTKAELIQGVGTSGSSFIGHSDASGRWTLTRLDLLLANEIASLNLLSSTTAGKGASLIGVQDLGSYYSSSDIEALLQEIGARMALLLGLTANATELNKLDGTSGNVTPSNLNALVTQLPTELHYHAMGSWYDDKIGNIFGPSLLPSGDFEIFSWLSTLDTRGNIRLNVYGPSVDGEVVVKRANSLGSPTDYQVIDRGHYGDFDLSSNSLFAGITTNTAALLLLANQVRGVQQTVGINYTVVDFSGTNATTADGNAAADPTTTAKYTQSSTTYILKRRTGFVQKTEHRFVQVWVYGKFAAGAASGGIKVMVDTAQAEATITSTTATLMKLTIDLSTVKVTVDTERQLLYYLKGDATINVSSMMEWIHARVEI